MKVYVIDNGGQWTHREWRVLRDLDVETKIIPNTTSFSDIAQMEADGIVLSGGAPRVGTAELELGNTGEYLDKAAFPILGICFGMHYMALHFGGAAGPAELPEFGKIELVIDEENDLFKGLPPKFQAWESHNDEVKTPLPDGFQALAHSTNCQVQAIKYLKKPFYGVQFHPEVEHTEHGYEIFKNFLKICEAD
ncbi:MAG: GMP synthase subunit A [Thermoplasmata archaeon]|nr:GMP synthase subunit A [Thermoplasmata archaeon]